MAQIGFGKLLEVAGVVGGNADIEVVLPIKNHPIKTSLLRVTSTEQPPLVVPKGIVVSPDR